MVKRTKPSIKRPIAGRVTVSAIIKDLEVQGLVKGSTRNLERKFSKFIDRFGGIRSEWQDENDHYSIEKKNKAIIEAMLIELNQEDAYTDRLLKDKRAQVNPDDVLRFFNNIAKYTQGKVDEETRQRYLAGLDEDIQYSFWGVCGDIFDAINVTILNIQNMPYPHQVSIMEELRHAVVTKWAGAIQQELEEIIQTKLDLLDFERELNEEEADS